MFSLDSTQLKKSIQAVYGEIDRVGYLQRFFDYEISLPETSDYRTFLTSRLRVDDMSLGVEINQLTKVTEKFSLSLRDLNVICKAYMKFLDAKPYLMEAVSVDKYQGYRKIYITLIAIKYKNPLSYMNLLSNGLTDNDMKDEFWKELFGYQTSTLESHHSFLSKKVLDTRLDLFPTANANSEHGRVFKHVLLEEDWNRGRMNWMKITLRQAIMNNVDSGVVHHAVYQKQVKE